VGLSEASVASTHPHCHFLFHSHMENLICMFSLLLLLLAPPFASAGHDYAQALSKSLLFFEAQRSGYLPHNQRVTWRAHSGLQDGKASGVTSKHKKSLILFILVFGFSWKVLVFIVSATKLQVDLVGGYYDAGDNVKFGLPMAFTVTMMSWSIIEYGKQMAASGELGHAMEAVKWGTDYFIKAHPQANVLYGEVLFLIILIVKVIFLFLLGVEF